MTLAFVVVALGDLLGALGGGNPALLSGAGLVAYEASRLVSYALIASGVLEVTRPSNPVVATLVRRVDAAVVLVCGAVALLAAGQLPLPSTLLDLSVMLPVSALRWLQDLLLVFAGAVLATSTPRRVSLPLLAAVVAELGAITVPVYVSTMTPMQVGGVVLGLHTLFVCSFCATGLSMPSTESTAPRRVSSHPGSGINPVPYLAVAATFYFLTTITGDPNSTLMVAGAAALCSVVLMRQFVLERVPVLPSLPALPSSEGDRLQALLTNSSDLILVLNPDGTAIYFSPSIRSILGYGGDVFWSRSLLELVHPEDVGGVRKLLTAAKANVSGVALRGEWRLRDAAGTWLHLEAMVTDHTAERGVGGLLLNIRDVTERKVLERQLRHQALHDPLTGLANRAFLLDRIEQASMNVRLEHRMVALLFLDLDDFKQINDTLGHGEGDKLLQEIGLRLASRCRSSDLVARLGGDEFAVLIESAATREEADDVAERILRDLRSPYALLRGRLLPSTSIGLAFLEPGLTSRELLRRADVAMYAAKVGGKNAARRFEAGMDEPLKRRMRLQNDLRDGLERGELSPRYQPIVSLATKQVVGVEALVRWEHPELGLLLPGAFLPAVQSAGLMTQLGAKVLRESCAEAQGWRSVSPGRDVFLSVNLSEEQIRQTDLVRTVATTLKQLSFPEDQLVLEIAESALINDEGSRRRLRELESLGFRIAIDDFGTEYSSLSYLRSLPIHWLKLDRSFVRYLESDAKSRHIVRAVVELCHSLEVQIIAEGVENEAQQDILTDLGCEYGQGFYYLEPTPGYEFRRLLGPDLRIDRSTPEWAQAGVQREEEAVAEEDGPARETLQPTIEDPAGGEVFPVGQRPLLVTQL